MRHTDLLPPSPGRGADPLDRMLFAFFRAELPNPWPKAPAPVRERPALAPAPEADRPRRSWTASPAWSMAAAVALLFAGYAWLAGNFPPPQEFSAPGPDGGLTGQKERVRPLMREEGYENLRNGGSAHFEEERFPGGVRNIRVEQVNPPAR